MHVKNTYIQGISMNKLIEILITVFSVFILYFEQGILGLPRSL